MRSAHAQRKPTSQFPPAAATTGTSPALRRGRTTPPTAASQCATLTAGPHPASNRVLLWTAKSSSSTSTSKPVTAASSQSALSMFPQTENCLSTPWTGSAMSVSHCASAIWKPVKICQTKSPASSTEHASTAPASTSTTQQSMIPGALTPCGGTPWVRRRTATRLCSEKTTKGSSSALSSPAPVTTCSSRPKRRPRPAPGSSPPRTRPPNHSRCGRVSRTSTIPSNTP